MTWTDKVRKVMRKFGICEGNWFSDVQERAAQKTKCRLGLEACEEEGGVM